MSQPLLAYNVWLALPAETRIKLTKVFSIPRTGEVIVQTGGIVEGNIGGIVKQDGHSASDLYAITTEKMQALLNTDDTDFYKMFNHIVENINYLTKPPIDVTVPNKYSDLKKNGKKHSPFNVKNEMASEGEEVKPEEVKNFAELMNDKPKAKKNAKKKEQK